MNKRSPEIDITKGMLLMGMIFNHVYRILGNGQSQVFNSIALFIDWVTFSGFFFCFGFAMWAAYFQKPQLPWRRIIRTAVKFYVVFVISGIASRIFLNSEKLSLDLVYRVAAIRDIPYLSEFLLSFVIITIFGAILRKPVYLITQRWEFLLIFITACLAATFFLQNSPELDPLISLFIGSKRFLVFPIVQYFPLFLIGAFTARNPQWFQMRIYLILSVLGLTSALIISALIEAPITRFPPSFTWILCSICFVFLYYGLAQFVLKKCPEAIQHYQITVGQNVLFYLLISNLIIFIGSLYKPELGLNSLQTVIAFMLIMSSIFLFRTSLSQIGKLLKKPTQQMVQQTSEQLDET